MLTERYGAFSFPMSNEEEDEEQTDDSVQRCLSGQQGFLGRGLLGASMSCNEGSCSPVFLGGGGRSVLICNTSERASPIPLLGGPWETVAAAGSDIWVMDSTSLVMLQMS